MSWQRLLLGAFIFTFFGIMIIYVKEFNLKCTDEQLHVVIEKVNQCKKQYVICSDKMKDQIIREVCK